MLAYEPFLSTYNWPCDYEHSLIVYAKTSCGTTVGVDGGPYSPICYARMSGNVALYPNPASNQVNISIKESGMQKGNKVNVPAGYLSGIAEVRLFDKTGLLKRILKYSSGTKLSTINLTGLPSDIYIIEVSDGKNKVRLQLSVTK